ncbi:MAG: transposase [Magnetococcales bacterium]|nr:transposase [Magnetococcales bacterium]
MMAKEISDELWVQIQPLLEPYRRTRRGGTKPIPFRDIFNGILHQLRTGCQWEMIPRCYGSKSTIHEHFQRWVAGGVFDQIFASNLKKYDELCGIHWEWQSMDGSLVQSPVREKKSGGRRVGQKSDRPRQK